MRVSEIIHWLETHTLPCFYKEFLGIECPGCGIQTAFIELLKGNILTSINTYPPLLPMLFMLIYLILHLKFNFKNGALCLKIIFIFTACLIVINYIYKIVTYKLS